jgi:integrase
MADVPRTRPPHLHRQVSRHGKAVWYVRIGKGRRIRIRSGFGTAEFHVEYQAAIAGLPSLQTAKDDRTLLGTLAWLVERYRKTNAWTDLSLATRRQRENILKHVLATAGNQPLSRITKASIIAGKDRRPGHQGRHFLDTMRGLFKWAAEAGLVKQDPTDRIKAVKPKIKGFPPWDDEDVAAYRNRWPIGTRQRVWLEVLIGTGLRRGDAVMLGKQHVRDGIATIKIEKTDTEVTIPISSELAQILATGPTGDLHFICNALGKPFTKASFGNAFGEACRMAGIKKSAHGVRKYKATTAAYKGATEPELDAMFGWTGGRMAAHYTREASRRRLAIAGASKLTKGTESVQSIPSPIEKVRE